MKTTRYSHKRKPWAVVRADGTIWGRYERRCDALIFSHLFNQPPMTKGGPYRVQRKKGRST